MIRRIKHIYTEFGAGALWRIALLVAGLIGFSLAGILVFGTFRELLVAIISVLIGFALRRQITDLMISTPRCIHGVLTVYFLVLIGCWITGQSLQTQLTVINLATAVVFNLQFWALSNPAIRKYEDEPFVWRG